MSAPAAYAVAVKEQARYAHRNHESLALRLTAFFGLAAFASLHYMTLVAHPPALRVLGVVAIATVGGAALARSGRMRSPATLATILRLLLALLALAVALLAIGIPTHLLLPSRWAMLGHDARHGFDALTAWQWPYRGADRWARLAVLSVPPVALVAAATVCFWPSPRRASERRVAAFSLLVALLIAGVANERGSAWRVQGAFLVVLIAAWLWLPRLHPAEANRAAWWLLACSALALLAAPALGASRPWIDYRDWNPFPVASTFQWDQLYGPITWSRSTATMFEIDEQHPALLKVTSLDRFDGVRFLRSNAPPGLPRLDLAATRAQGRWYRRATVTVGGLRSTLLVSAGGVPVDLSWLKNGQTAVRQSDGTTVSSSALTRGARYRVLSYEPAPTAAVLRRAPRRFPRVYLPYTQFELPNATASGLLAPNLRADASARVSRAALVGAPLPGRAPASDPAIARRIESSPYGPMFALARHLAAGAPTSYDIAQRVERFLLGRYAYDESPPPDRYPLEAFLFKDRRGYCQQFSGAMVLMLRMEGIPARVAAGFKPGVYDPASGSWRVRALDAHSWVEVFFSGIGWVPFDPTPPRGSRASAAGTGRFSKAALAASAPGADAGGAHGPTAPASGPRPSEPSGGASPWLLAIVMLAALGALALASWWVTGARRLRQALDGDASGAVAELRSALARLGYRIAPATTLAQLEARLELPRGPASSGYLRLLRDVRYGPGRSSRALRRARRELRRALGTGGVLARLRALAALPPGAARRA